MVWNDELSINVGQLRERVPANLGLDTYRQLAEEASADIILAHGKHPVAPEDGFVEDIHYIWDEGIRLLFLRQQLMSIDSIAVNYRNTLYLPGFTRDILDSSWTLDPGGEVLRRVDGYYWWGEITVRGTPDMTEITTRRGMLVDLVRLAVQYNALSRERSGSYESYSVSNYQRERESILNRLKVGGLMV